MSTTLYLGTAKEAAARQDWLTTHQFGLKAFCAPAATPAERCEARRLLALSSLQVGLVEDALSHAVGAHLLATVIGDPVAEREAVELVGLIMAHQPQLGEEGRSNVPKEFRVM
jgi:hypothetical protein